MFLFDPNDQLVRLANSTFTGMLEAPAAHRLPGFAGQRVRAAEVLVELRHREPVRIIRTAFEILPFDEKGCLDSQSFLDHQFACAAAVLNGLRVETDSPMPVIDAANRFLARGGRWTPSSALEKTIHDAALGRIRCARL